MSPTLQRGDHLLVLKRLTSLKNGDIVIFSLNKYEYSFKNKFFVKRIHEIYTNSNNLLSYNLLGDNLKNSLDSRILGPIDHERLQGKVLLVYYPFSRLRVFF